MGIAAVYVGAYYFMYNTNVSFNYILLTLMGTQAQEKNVFEHKILIDVTHNATKTQVLGIKKNMFTRVIRKPLFFHILFIVLVLDDRNVDIQSLGVLNYDVNSV